MISFSADGLSDVVSCDGCMYKRPGDTPPDDWQCRVTGNLSPDRQIRAEQFRVDWCPACVEKWARRERLAREDSSK